MIKGVLAIFAAALGFGFAATAHAQETGTYGQPVNWQLGFQQSVTPVGDRMYDFHNLLLIVIAGITVLVMALLVVVMLRFNHRRNPTPSSTSHNTLLEIAWTIVPVLILLVIAVPSFRLLYFQDRVVNPEMTLVAHGYQWYWGYEYPDQQVEEFPSYMIPDSEIDPAAGQVRLLSVDNPVVLPVDTDIQLLVTAGDVIHSFAVPSFGVKTDAVPGRMNETWVRITREGTYFGQCSELCGTDHAFMPIEVQAVSREAFDQWVLEQIGDAEIDPENPPVLLTMSWEEALEQRATRLASASQ